MKNNKNLFIFLFISPFLFSCATQSKPSYGENKTQAPFTKSIENKSDKPNFEAKSERKSLKYEPSKINIESTVNKEENIKHENFPKGFKGDSIVNLIKKAGKIDKQLDDEFTKTSEHEHMFSELNYKNYTFIYNGNRDSADLHFKYKYSADEEIINVEIMARSKYFDYGAYNSISLTNNLNSNQYIGQNGFGAITEVNSHHNKAFGVAFTNVGKVGAMYQEVPLYSLSIPAYTKQAKLLKYDIAVYFTVELEYPVKNRLTLTEYGEVEATIAEPEKWSHTLKCLPVKLKEVGFFKKSTGEVLGRKIF